jgi:ubiquinone/menaquinone biosynthesis C-methylase UbiE
MSGTENPVLPHNTRPAAVWSSGGAAYDEISRGIASAIEHCIIRLRPQPGDKFLDVATGSGLTSRRLAEHGASVTGLDMAEGLLKAAEQVAKRHSLQIEYRLGDAERFPFVDAAFDALSSTFGVCS